MGALIVRPLDEADVDACAAIMFGLPLWRRYGVTTFDAARARIGRMYTESRAGHSRTQVADDRGRAVGFVYYLLRGTFGHSGYVWSVGVASDRQGRGIGGRLMDAAETDIFATDPNVFLLVSADNAGAQRFYERRGYRRVGELPDYVIPGITEIVYRKTRGPIHTDNS